MWPGVRRTRDALQRAKSVHDLRWLSGNRLEQLKGDRSGEWSLRVNDQEWHIECAWTASDAGARP